MFGQDDISLVIVPICESIDSPPELCLCSSVGFSFPTDKRDRKAQPPELTDQQLKQHEHGEEPVPYYTP